MRSYLKKLRDDNSVTQDALSEAIGISQNHYSNIENGARQKVIDLSLLVKIADYYSVPVQQLIEQELALLKEEGA